MTFDSRLTEHKEVIDLRKSFPRSFRSVFRRSWHWIGSYLLAISLLAITIPTEDINSFHLSQEIFQTLTFVVVVGGFIILLLKLIYEFIFHAVYYYGIEADHFVISRNVLLKHRASFPLAAITDVHLDRKVIDLFFAVYALRIATPHLASARFSKISGLSRKNAIELQDYLTSLIETLHPQIHDIPPPEGTRIANADSNNTLSKTNFTHPGN